MVEAANIDIVTRFYAAMQAGDVGAILKIADEHIVVEQSDRLPWGGRYEGRQAFARFGATVRQHLTSQVTIDRYVAAGSRVGAVGSTRGETVRLKRAFNIPLVHLFNLEDGRICRLEIMVDVPMMLAALA